VIAIDEGFQPGEGFFAWGSVMNYGEGNKETLQIYKAYLKPAQKSQMANAVLRKISLFEQ
jgi:hypothetical protein